MGTRENDRTISAIATSWDSWILSVWFGPDILIDIGYGSVLSANLYN